MKHIFSFLVFCLSVLSSIRAQNFENAIKISTEDIDKFLIKETVPGLCVGINYKGKHVWVHSSGYSDIENEVKFRNENVLRTGSLSKGIQTALVAKMVEQNLIAWDSDIHRYISEKNFPKKKWNGQDVNITVRQLITMTGGIRSSEELRDFRHLPTAQNVTDTLSYFANDPLVAKPGTKFYYSNWGWHLIGAIMESVMKQDFEKIMHKMFAELHMNSTRLSRRELLIAHRTRPYTRTLSPDKKHHILESAAMVEDMGRPLPWLPMGGIITSVPDLLTFTNVMLKSYRTDDYLKSATVKELWTPHLSNYGMGWFIGSYNIHDITHNTTRTVPYIHYGGVVAGSVCSLAMIPELDISVALIANLGNIGLDSIGLTVLNNFVNAIPKLF